MSWLINSFCLSHSSSQSLSVRATSGPRPTAPSPGVHPSGTSISLVPMGSRAPSSSSWGTGCEEEEVWSVYTTAHVSGACFIAQNIVLLLAACLAWPAYIVKDGVAGISSDLHACFRSLGAIPPGAGVPPGGTAGFRSLQRTPHREVNTCSLAGSLACVLCSFVLTMVIGDCYDRLRQYWSCFFKTSAQKTCVRLS